MINPRFIVFTNSVIIVPYLHYWFIFSCFPYRIRESFFLSFQCVSTIVQLPTVIFSPSNTLISLVENQLIIEFMAHLRTVSHPYIYSFIPIPHCFDHYYCLNSRLFSYLNSYLTYTWFWESVFLFLVVLEVKPWTLHARSKLSLKYAAISTKRVGRL